MSVLRWPEMKTEAKIKIVSPFVQFVAGQIQASTLYTRVQNNRTPCVIDCMSVKTHGYSVATRRKALEAAQSTRPIGSGRGRARCLDGAGIDREVFLQAAAP